MFEFLRRKPAPESDSETKALPEATPEDEVDGDEAVKTAVEAALLERAEPEREPEPEPQPQPASSAAPPATTIGADMKVGGSINTTSPLIIAGVIEGDVACGVLTIEADGEVQGDVRASEDVVVTGTVRGSMDVDGKLEIAASGRVIGNVNARAIVIDEGGELRGRCSMGAPKASTGAKADDSFIGKMLDDDDTPDLAVVS